MPYNVEMMVEIDSAAVQPQAFTADELARFERDGFLIVRGLAGETQRQRMLEVTLDGLARLVEPIEFEADLHYPGAPDSRTAAGGHTVRRLKQALSRDYSFVEWITHPALVARLVQLLGPAYFCPLAHHNCIMAKQPAFSSDTGWHQDIRYWSFDRPDLVSTWLALGDEREENGCLRVIPGSHRLELDRGRFDAALFFRDDLEANRELIDRAIPVLLAPGDLLLFHCRLIHAAGANRTADVKLSLVFTSHAADNRPIAGTRSANYPSLSIA